VCNEGQGGAHMAAPTAVARRIGLERAKQVVLSKADAHGGCAVPGRDVLCTRHRFFWISEVLRHPWKTNECCVIEQVRGADRFGDALSGGGFGRPAIGATLQGQTVRR